MISLTWLYPSILAVIALASIWVTGHWRAGYTLALLVLVLAGIAFGFEIRGKITNHDAMNYYYAGEANGYNRGYAEGKMQRTGLADNSTLRQFTPFDFRSFD